MRKLLIPLLILGGCSTAQTNDLPPIVQQVDSPAMPVPRNFYYVGYIYYSYDKLDGSNHNGITASEIIEKGHISNKERYVILDEMVKLLPLQYTSLPNFKITKREVLGYDSYPEASENRLNIIQQ